MGIGENEMRVFARYCLIGFVSVILSSNTVTESRAQIGSASAPVQQFDPAMAQLVSPSTGVEVLKGDYFGVTEGPLWVPEGKSGFLLFSDLAANAIYKWQDGTLSVFLEKSGFTGTDSSTAGLEFNNGRLQVIALGSNGLTLDRQGRLIIAQHGDRRLVRRESDGSMTVLAERYEGKRLNSPNDVVVKSNGSIFFTDPSPGLRGGDKSPVKEMEGHGVFLVKDGRLTMLDNDPQGIAPNGITLSPDERTLYVAVFRKLVAYDVSANDAVTNARVFFDYDTYTKDRGGFDGIKVDSKGNVWGVGPGGIWAISPTGKALGRILVPEPPTNLAFGDVDGRGIYITARRGLYRARVLVPGIQHKSK
jgi:gluconolactonase